LSDLAESLATAAGTVGQLQRFVVDIMLLEPAVARAVRALDPVVELTKAGRGVDAKTTASEPSRTVTEVARKPADESR
jgi:hypothetical protein